MAKRPPKPTKKFFHQTAASDRRMQDALHRYDDVLARIESKWGVDRLPWLVGTDLRERFDQQMEKLNKAIEDRHDVEHQVEVTLRGVAALEAEAVRRGCEPLSGEYIEVAMPDGRVLAITRTSWEVPKVKRENRDMVVYSAEEVANIIVGFEDKAKPVNAIKETFPGAAVEPVKTQTELELDDEIPF